MLGRGDDGSHDDPVVELPQGRIGTEEVFFDLQVGFLEDVEVAEGEGGREEVE